jgi:GTP-binding protein Era
VSITSERPQTTRNRILGIKNLPGHQVVFVDTPGIHESDRRFNRYLLECALASYTDSNAILFLIDGLEKYQEEDRFVAGTLKKIKTPVILVINKIDRIEKGPLLRLIDTYKDLHPFEEIVPVSALTGENLDRLLELILKFLPAGPQYFPVEMVTDQREEFLISELIRERVFGSVFQEVPYSVAVRIDNVVRKTEDLAVIHASILVEHPSQKGILIGKKGEMLKRIGTGARKQIEKRLGGKVYLDLRVKVLEKWTRDDKALFDLGYRPQ